MDVDHLGLFYVDLSSLLSTELLDNPLWFFPSKGRNHITVLLSSHLTVAILEVVSKFQLQLNNTKKMHSTFMYIYYRLKSTLEKFGIL